MIITAILVHCEVVNFLVWLNRMQRGIRLKGLTHTENRLEDQEVANRIYKSLRRLMMNMLNGWVLDDESFEWIRRRTRIDSRKWSLFWNRRGNWVEWLSHVPPLWAVFVTFSLVGPQLLLEGIWYPPWEVQVVFFAEFYFVGEESGGTASQSLGFDQMVVLTKNTETGLTRNLENWEQLTDN